MKLHVIIFALFASLAFGAYGAAHQPILITHTHDSDAAEPNKHTWEIEHHNQRFSIDGDTVEWRNKDPFSIVVLQTTNVTWDDSISMKKFQPYTTCPFDQPPSGCSFRKMEAWQDGTNWVVKMDVKGTKGTGTSERPLYFVLASVQTGLVLHSSSQKGTLAFPFDYYAMTDAMLSW
jgi:hypothetical protein